jgi:hypothetical protein
MTAACLRLACSIVDRGSTDISFEIIRQLRTWLPSRVSQTDDG